LGFLVRNLLRRIAHHPICWSTFEHYRRSSVCIDCPAVWAFACELRSEVPDLEYFFKRTLIKRNRCPSNAL
jgi:hypothetical protein